MTPCIRFGTIRSLMHVNYCRNSRRHTNPWCRACDGSPLLLRFHNAPHCIANVYAAAGATTNLIAGHNLFINPPYTPHARNIPLACCRLFLSTVPSSSRISAVRLAGRRSANGNKTQDVWAWKEHSEVKKMIDVVHWILATGTVEEESHRTQQQLATGNNDRSHRSRPWRS